MNAGFFISTGIAIALALTACNKESTLSADPIPCRLTVTLPDPPTKTSIDGWNTYWEKGDRISVFVTRNSKSGNYYGHSLFTCQNGGSFEGEVDSKFEKPFNWFAIYPSGSYGSTSSSVSVSVNHPRNQTQTGDLNSHICGENAPLYGFAFGKNSNPVIAMHQIASVLVFEIENGTSSNIRVTGIRFTAPERISGKFSTTIDLRNMSEEKVPQWKAGSSSSYDNVCLDVTAGKTVAPGCKGNFYAAIHPVSASGDYTIEVTAVSEGKLMTAAKTVKGHFTFNPGEYRTIRFNFANPQETDATCIENPHLKMYLDKLESTPYYTNDTFVPYSFYTHTLMSENLYGDNSAANRLDQPSPVRLFWEGEASSLEIFKGEAGTSRIITMELDGTEDAMIYNLIPGEKYSFTASNGTEVIAEGDFIPTGRRRMMMTSSNFSKEYAINCRDLGGLPITGGGHIKYGLIYRGSSMDGLKKDAGMMDVFLNVMGITLDVDLRDADQKKGNVQDFTEFGITRTPQDYSWKVTTDLRDPVKVRATLDSVFTHVLDDRPVYLHCSIGSDRTGYFCLLIESLIGVSQNWTDSDYEITSFASSKTDGPRLRTEDVNTSGRHYKKGLDFLEDFEGVTLQEKVYDYVVTSSQGLMMDRTTVDKFIEKMKAE